MIFALTFLAFIAVIQYLSLKQLRDAQQKANNIQNAIEDCLMILNSKTNKNPKDHFFGDEAGLAPARDKDLSGWTFFDIEEDPSLWWKTPNKEYPTDTP